MASWLKNAQNLGVSENEAYLQHPPTMAIWEIGDHMTRGFTVDGPGALYFHTHLAIWPLEMW